MENQLKLNFLLNILDILLSNLNGFGWNSKSKINNLVKSNKTTYGI